MGEDVVKYCVIFSGQFCGNPAAKRHYSSGRMRAVQGMESNIVLERLDIFLERHSEALSNHYTTADAARRPNMFFNTGSCMEEYLQPPPEFFKGYKKGKDDGYEIGKGEYDKAYNAGYSRSRDDSLQDQFKGKGYGSLIGKHIDLKGNKPY